MNPQDEFVHRLTAKLDQGLTQFDTPTARRLASMRRAAIAHPPAAHGLNTALAWAYKHARHARIVAALTLALMIAFWWLSQQPAPSYSAETDILLLTGDLPPDVYADNTFSQWLEARAAF